MSQSEKDNMGNSTSNYLWTRTYTEIKSKHDSAFIAIEEAITLEENEKPNEAIEKYKRGVLLIDEALSIQVRCPDTTETTWKAACSMIQKLKSARAEVLMRINAIQTSPTFVHTLPEEQPPSYQAATNSSCDTTSNSNVPTYKDLAAALNDLSIDPNEKMNEELIYHHEGVRLYFISPNGEVTSTMEPQTLRIFLVNGEEVCNAPKAILQIGDWVYPLVPCVSPCYRTDYGAFILPNVYEEVSGSSIGIILPSDADSEVYDLLENILHGIISQTTPEKMRVRREERKPHVHPTSEDMSSKISNKIVDGAYFISQGLVRGAEKAGEFFDYGTPKVINQMNPSEQPAHIPQKLTKSMQVAENATHKAVRVTGFIADKVGIATMKLGQFLAPHIQKQGTRLLTTGFNMPEEEASNKVQGVLTVAAGAVEGFSAVYRGLETSATILGQNLKSNTVKIVNHKYGRPAGEFADDTLNTMGNVYSISQNTKIITPKGLAKRTAKDTGRAVVYGAKTGTASSSQSKTYVAPETSRDHSEPMEVVPTTSPFNLSDGEMQKK